MANLAHVLVQPAGQRQAGHIIRESRELSKLSLMHAVVLPVDDDLVPPVAHSAIDGFFIKNYGDGWTVSKGSGERCCPMVLRVLPDRNHVHWAARVVPVPGFQATGRIRLTADTSQTAYINAGLSQQLIPNLLETMPLDAEGGWTLMGRSLINVTAEGILAMSLHAVTRNARILWSAVSLTSHGTDR